MGVVRNLLATLLILAGIMIFATYTPSDPRYFWMYWCTVWVFLAFGLLIETMFGDQMSFVFDPNPEVNNLFYYIFNSTKLIFDICNILCRIGDAKPILKVNEAFRTVAYSDARLI